MRNWFRPIAATAVVTPVLLFAPPASASNYSDCFSASGRADSSGKEYVVDITNNCRLDKSIPMGTTAIYRIDLSGGYCARSEGTLFLSSFGSTVRIDLSCLQPGRYSAQVQIRSFADGSSNFLNLDSVTIPEPPRTESAKPTKSPSTGTESNSSSRPATPGTTAPQHSNGPGSGIPALPYYEDFGEDLTVTGLPYGAYSRGGTGSTCFSFPDGDEDPGCVQGSHWAYRVCYASAKGLKLQVRSAGTWKTVPGKFARKDGCEPDSYSWTVDVHVKEKTLGKKQYRILNPAQNGRGSDVMRINIETLP